MLHRKISELQFDVSLNEVHQKLECFTETH